MIAVGCFEQEILYSAIRPPHSGAILIGRVPKQSLRNLQGKKGNWQGNPGAHVLAQSGLDFLSQLIPYWTHLSDLTLLVVKLWIATLVGEGWVPGHPLVSL